MRSRWAVRSQEGDLLMTEMTGQVQLDAETEDFAQQIADSVSSFLLALKAIAREADGGRAVSLLLLEISQVLLAGARLGAQRDFTPRAEYQPDVGPEPDLDQMRLRLPVYDQALTALIEDNYERGLDRKILVCASSSSGGRRR